VRNSVRHGCPEPLDSASELRERPDLELAEDAAEASLDRVLAKKARTVVELLTRSRRVFVEPALGFADRVEPEAAAADAADFVAEVLLEDVR
jgi:hypothetical protein